MISQKKSIREKQAYPKKGITQEKILAPWGLLETRDTEIPALQGKKIAQNQPETRI